MNETYFLERNGVWDFFFLAQGHAKKFDTYVSGISIKLLQ